MDEKLILEPGDSSPIKPAYDPFWDSPPKRRELQAALRKIGQNMTEFWSGLDTNCLVVNFLCEKLGVTRKELDEYVKKKAQEAEALKRIAEDQEKQKNAEASV